MSVNQLGAMTILMQAADIEEEESPCVNCFVDTMCAACFGLWALVERWLDDPPPNKPPGSSL